MEGLSIKVNMFYWLTHCKYSHTSAVTLFPVRQNPERTFYWFFEATCPVARDKGKSSVFFPNTAHLGHIVFANSVIPSL